MSTQQPDDELQVTLHALLDTALDHLADALPPDVRERADYVQAASALLYCEGDALCRSILAAVADERATRYGEPLPVDQQALVIAFAGQELAALQTRAVDRVSTLADRGDPEAADRLRKRFALHRAQQRRRQPLDVTLDAVGINPRFDIVTGERLDTATERARQEARRGIGHLDALREALRDDADGTRQQEAQRRSRPIHADLLSAIDSAAAGDPA